MLTNEQKNIPIRLHDGLTINFYKGNDHHRGTIMQTGYSIWMLMCEPDYKNTMWNLYAYNRWSDDVLKTISNTTTIAQLEMVYGITVNCYSLAKPIGSKG